MTAEYGLLTLLAALFVVFGATWLGDTIGGALEQAATSIEGPLAAASPERTPR